MGVLAEYLRTEGATIKAEKAKRRQVLQEWTDSLTELFRQIQEWLRACDPGGLIEQRIEQTDGKELAFGEYQVPVLKLNLVDRSAQFVPVARYMLATIKLPGHEKAIRTQGVVELRGLGGRTYYLFRGTDQWYIQSEAQNLRVDGNDVELLTPDRLESAIRYTLS